MELEVEIKSSTINRILLGLNLLFALANVGVVISGNATGGHWAAAGACTIVTLWCLKDELDSRTRRSRTEES